jgi:hypothetical protein
MYLLHSIVGMVYKLFNYALTFRNKKKAMYNFQMVFLCCWHLFLFSIFHYFDFELVILWPKHSIPTDNISCALQDKKSVYVVRGVKCWLNMRHCRWIIIELLINTLMLSVVCPIVIFLLVIVVSNSTPTSWWVTNIFLTHDDQYLYSELMITDNSTRNS